MFTQEYIEDLCNDAIDHVNKLIAKEEFSNAEAVLKQLLKVNPYMTSAKSLLGTIFIKNGKVDEAIEIYDELLKSEEINYALKNDAALAYACAGMHKKAIHLLMECIEEEPEIPLAYGNLAIQYLSNNKTKRAKFTLEAALEKIPGSADLHFQYGTVLTQSNNHELALAQYEKTLQLRPEFHAAKYNLALTNLALGNLPQGFSQYEARWECNPAFKTATERARMAGFQEWKGESLDNKSIFVYNEQGIGDALQFIRYLPQLRQIGAEVFFEIPNELENLLGGVDGVDQLVPIGVLPRTNYYVSICSLPYILATSKRNIPGLKPYLKPTGIIPTEHFDAYKDFKKIGIVWGGNPTHRMDEQRSIPLINFKPLHDLPGVKLFSLQKDTRQRIYNGKVVDLTEGCDDFSIVDMKDVLIDWNYTAAVIEKMDLVICADTAVAHLAGAMGKPCWVLLSNLCDWRWGIKGNKSYWYSSLKLFRQSTLGDWNGVFKKVVSTLKKELSPSHA